MSHYLLIVESPAKAKTINKYLGKEFQVLASYGHVRDLVPKEGAVDPAHGFAMKYAPIARSSKHLDAIASALGKTDIVYLATDPDREGEAISWHLQQFLEEKGLLKGKPVQRVVFHEITQRAITEAMKHPRDISTDLVNAQQARRALDYLVGFNLSPLLWRKVRRGLSAGRVQSPALRLIVEREEEIERFEAREYWTVEAELIKGTHHFPARLIELEGEKIEQFSITDAARAETVRTRLLAAAQGALNVERVERKQKKRNPAAPFITSTLQQEAARKLGFTAKRTMQIAQQLYEGIDLGGEQVGLITYMRTDSVALAQEAVQEIRAYIEERYGKDQVPAQPRIYKTRAKNAQEAHEAIRPTAIARDPGALRRALSPDQAKLYELIWKRTLASQMLHATYDTVSVTLTAGDAGRFRATGQTLVHPGFIAVYQEGRDEQSDEDENRELPPLAEGESIPLTDIRTDQHFTEPPPRFSEATLVKALEEFGIGRPSTYASIISTLQDREYVVLDRKRFVPTDVGRIVNRFLTQHFTQYVDYQFTARLEDQLDAISRGERDWVPVLEDFWTPFKQRVDETLENVSRAEVTTEALDEACPKCGKPLAIRLGRRGRFVGCSGYPECDYTRNLEDKGEEAPPERVEGRVCPECSSPLEIKHGRYGKFIGCSSYPKCKHIEPLVKPLETGVTCPECREGELLQRKSRYGKLFYSCNRYPGCKYAVWNPPLAEPCPQCGWPILTLKTTKRRGTEKVCPQKECGYAVPAEDTALADAG
ncbi:MAG TPA: type I DNA topoisomerase [Candidatus Macondimonas sp.]|nr:type I DNA topoisomerase [Candidatus Macondimonas sp.]